MTIDVEVARDANKDRLTVYDGTAGDADAGGGGSPSAMTWTAGGTTVPVTFNSRSGTAQLPPNENGTVSFTFAGAPKQLPLRTVAGGACDALRFTAMAKPKLATPTRPSQQVVF